MLEKRDIILLKKSDDEENTKLIYAVFFNDYLITEEGELIFVGTSDIERINRTFYITILKIWRGAPNYRTCLMKSAEKYLIYDISNKEAEKTKETSFTKKDLKTGDFILFKNGSMGVVIKELNTVVLDTRENLDLNKLDEDLPLEQTIVSIVWRGPLSFKACLNSDNSDKIIFKQTKEEEE